MAKVLYINSNPNPGKSYSKEAAQAFLEAYKSAHPDDLVEVLDLPRANVPYIDTVDMSAINKAYAGSNDLTDGEQSRFEEHMKYVNQFLSADKYIVVAPMWNFSVPAVLKSWVDQIVVKDQTFEYTEKGPVGLVEDKKMMIVAARGGDYSQPPWSDMEFGVKWLRAIFGFLGVKDIDEIVVQPTAMGNAEEALSKAVDEAKSKASGF